MFKELEEIQNVTVIEQKSKEKRENKSPKKKGK